MRIIFFDTETTGLPKSKKISALDASNNWPDLVSICWMVFENTDHIRTENHMIKPKGWTIPRESSNIHGITEAIANREGKTLSEVLSLFKHDIESAGYIIAHNIHFDKNVVFHAYKWRLGVDPRPFWNSEAELCTAELSKDEMKLVGMYTKPGEYKFPRLDELYENTFKCRAPENAHNALRDVEVLQKIVWKRWDLRDDDGVILNAAAV
jgi:DNA polymerase III epsilon subunit-like protein